MGVKRTMRFVVTHHEDLGFDGLLPEDSPSTFYPVSAMGAAHDMVEHEHYGPEMGTLHDEMKAFGVVHWLRGLGDYWSKTTRQIHTTAPENTCSEIVMFFMNWFTDPEGDRFEPCPAVPMISCEGRAMIEETMRLVQEEAGREQFFGMDGEQCAYDAMEPYFVDIERWLRVGWASAEKRFAGHTPGEACDAFISLQKGIEHMMKSSFWRVGDVIEATWDDATLQWTAVWDL